MAGQKRWKRGKEKRHGGQFTPWIHACGKSPNFYRLTFKSRALLFEFLTQYNGENNGNLCCAWGLMKERGWQSSRTVQRACEELLDTGWIALTRQGGRNAPNLYALTMFDIDYCGGKLDLWVPVGKRLSYWTMGHNPSRGRDHEAA